MYKKFGVLALAFVLSACQATSGGVEYGVSISKTPPPIGEVNYQYEPHQKVNMLTIL